MKIRRTLAVVLTFLIVMSMLPTMVFASEDAVQLTGELKFNGKTEESVEVGNVLSADYRKVFPEGMTDDMVTFLWTELEPDDVEFQKSFPLEDRQYFDLRELGREKTLTVTEDLIGYDIMLIITAKEEYGITGSLYVISDPVVAALSSENDTEEVYVDISDEESPLFPEDDPAYAEEYFEPDAGEDEMDSFVFDDEEELEFQDDSKSQADSDPGEEEVSGFYEDDPDGVIDILTSEFYDSEDSETQVTDSPDEEIIEDPVYDLAVNTEKVDFGTLESSDESSYYAQQAQVVEVTNIGTEELNFAEITPEHFMVADIEEPLEPSDSVTLWIQPRAGLEPGTYTDTISYVSQEGAAVTYDASVVIEEPQASEPAQAEVSDLSDELYLDPADEILLDVPDGDVLEAVDSPDGVNVIAAAANDPDTAEVSDPQESDPEKSGEEDPDQDPNETSDDLSDGDGTLDDELESDDNAEEELVISLQFSDEVYKSLDFGEAEEGEAVPDAQAVVITNTGNVAITLKEPSGVTDAFNVSHTDDLTLEPGESLTFTIQPKADLPAGTQEGYINFYLEGEDVARLSTWVSFRIIEKKQAETVKLTGVQEPADIAGVENGTEKEASALGLPASVVIETSEGDKSAAVVWNVQDSNYQPDKKIAQTFLVTGTVVLPDGVTNPDGISLQLAVNVSVDAEEYEPVTVSSSDNKITGIVNNGEYPAQQGIKFQAVGAGMSNKDPQIGDQRYLPLSCTVVKTYTWESAPYEATIRLSNPGDYKLKVVFNLQEYTEAGWTNVAGAQDTKTVNFRVVSTNATVTATPTITPTPAGKKAVATEDNHPIEQLLIIMMAAAVVMGGVLMVRGKKY